MNFTPKDLVYSFRSGRGAVGKESVTSAELIATAKDDSPSLRHTGDTGHEFLSRREEDIVYNFEDVFLRSKTNSTKFYRGPLAVGTDALGIVQANWPVVPAINDGYFGPLLIKQSKPDTPIAGISQFLGELERVPRNLVNPDYLKLRINKFRLLGGDYLNLAFGWVPFISDLQKMVKVMININTIATNIYRDSGRWVRRQRSVEPIVKNQILGVLNTPYGLNYLDGSESDQFFTVGRSATLTVTLETIEKYRFSGAFIYFLGGKDSEPGDIGQQLSVLDRVLGTNVTPEVLWELLRYSWLADWLANIGAVIDNVTSFSSDRLVMPYAYLMRETHITRTATLAGTGLYSYPAAIHPTATQKVVQKERIRATPYGFGLNPNGFSARQWAILGALGLTMGPTSLRRL